MQEFLDSNVLDTIAERPSKSKEPYKTAINRKNDTHFN